MGSLQHQKEVKFPLHYKSPSKKLSRFKISGSNQVEEFSGKDTRIGYNANTKYSLKTRKSAEAKFLQ